MAYDLSEVINQLEEIKARGFIRTHRSGPTGIGKTIEDLLGITENNVASADLEDLGELKAYRRGQTSRITLFTKTPQPARINGVLLDLYGYYDSNRNRNKILHTTLDASEGFNNVNQTGYGFKVFADENKLHLLSNFPKQVEAYWNMDDLRRCFETKLPKLFVVIADTNKQKGANEHFHYSEAYIFEGLNFERFIQAINEGLIKIDIRIGQYPNGRIHDHGTAFRIMPDSLLDLFANKIKLL